MPSGISAVLCLNGKTLDRHLSAAGKEGSVLIVSGSLTVRGSGTITGGHTAGYGGGLWVTSGGSFTMNGGVVTGYGASRTVFAGGDVTVTGGRISSDFSTAIQVYNEGNSGAGSLRLTGGTVVAQTRGKQAVTVSGGAVFSLSGSPVLDSADSANVFLREGAVIRLTGALGADVDICLRTDGPGVFLRGEDFSLTDAVLSHFSCSDAAYGVRLNGSNEAELFARERYNVVFSAGGGIGVMEDMPAYAGVDFVLPGCGFSAPEGMIFSAWSVIVGGAEPAEYAEGIGIAVDADAAATAVWAFVPFGAPDLKIPAGTLAIGESAFEGVAATAVEIPANCLSVGDRAFRNCADLTRIRIPEGCSLGVDVFDGCVKVFVYGTAGSPAEDYCSAHDNCVFVEEAAQ